MSKVWTDAVAAIVAVLICEAAGGIGGIATASSVKEWYPTLNKPAFNPPSWVFGPVWTALYAMMGIAAWLVWRSGGWGRPSVRAALTLFIAQLALNAPWSWIFFGLRQPFWAFVDLVALWALIMATTVLFFRISIPAGALMLPYIAWVSFAGLLNYFIWRLNS